MSIQHFQAPMGLGPEQTAPFQRRPGSLPGRATQPFRFLDLPAEIRKTIYDLWTPTVLHASLGCRGIRLGYFEEVGGNPYYQAICLHLFFLNRQFYQEFYYALFVRSTWHFSSADLLPKVLGRLPSSTRSMIRHVSVHLTAPCVKETSMAARELQDRLAIGAFQRAQLYLRHMTHLQTLVLNINLTDFRCRGAHHGARILARDDDNSNNNTAGVLMANCVADFTWQGLRTRVPFIESHLSLGFLDTLRQRCGEANVSLVLRGKHRYAGQMVDVVIAQCASLEQLESEGGNGSKP